MDQKDKKIEQLEKEIKALKGAYNILEQLVRKLNSRVVRTDEGIRKVNADIVNIKRRG